MESRSYDNETPIEMMLGLNPVGFSFEMEGCMGRASVGEWKKKGTSKEMWSF